MGDYIEITDLSQRIPLQTQINLADDKTADEPVLTAQQITDLRAAILAGSDPTAARLIAIVAVLNGVIEDGEAKVNDYLSYREATVPVPTPFDPIIKTHSITFATWFLYMRRQDVTNDVQAMFDDAVTWGEEIITSSRSTDTPRPGSTPDAQFAGTNREFSQTSLKEW